LATRGNSPERDPRWREAELVSIFSQERERMANIGERFDWRVRGIRQSVLKNHGYKPFVSEVSRRSEELFGAAARPGAALYKKDGGPCVI